MAGNKQPVFEIVETKVSDFFRMYADKLDSPECQERVKQVEGDKQLQENYREAVRKAQSVLMRLGYDPANGSSVDHWYG